MTIAFTRSAVSTGTNGDPSGPASTAGTTRYVQSSGWASARGTGSSRQLELRDFLRERDVPQKIGREVGPIELRARRVALAHPRERQRDEDEHQVQDERQATVSRAVQAGEGQVRRRTRPDASPHNRREHEPRGQEAQNPGAPSLTGTQKASAVSP